MMQTNESRKTEIAKAVKVFKEMLEKTYIGEDKAPFYGIGVFNLTQMINGNYTRTANKDLLKMQISLPASEVVRDDVKGIPMKFNDWKLFPVVIMLHSTDEFQEKNNG